MCIYLSIYIYIYIYIYIMSILLEKENNFAKTQQIFSKKY